VRELSAHQVLDIHVVPFTADQQVLIGSPRLMRSAKRPTKSGGSRAAVWRAIACTRLSAHKQALPFRTLVAFFLARLALGNVLRGGNHVHGHLIDDSPSDHPATPLGLAYATAAGYRPFTLTGSQCQCH
jgi:hypothetical protein